VISIVGTAAVLFLGMGIFALRWPERVVRMFGVTSLGVDGRNEVRAVYGGFGVAIAGVLLAGLVWPVLTPGILLSVAAALLGMAIGRIVAWWLDGSDGNYPWLFFALEITLGGLLLVALFGLE
jgi:hypothetical protein